MISNHISTIKPNLYSFNYVNHKAQKMNITLLSTVKPKSNPFFFFFFFFKSLACLTPASLSSQDRFNTLNLRLSNSNISLPFFVSSSPYLSESLLHTSSLSPVLLLFLSFTVSKLLI